MELLFDKANEVARLINGIQGAADIKVEQVEGLPQLRINYDRAQLARYGLSIQDANRIVESSFGGMKAGTVFQGERRFDLVVRLGENYRKDLDLNNLTIGLKNGLQLPFSEIATIETEEGPAQISREDAKRRVTIGINVRNRDVESLVTEIKSKLDAQLSLPSGYFISYGGQFQNLQEAKQRLLVAVPIALLLIMVMLYFAFRRLRLALLIFSAVPLSAIGGVAALYIRDMPFSISAGVGFIALFGVAVLNGIVLINYYNQLQKDGITDLQEIIVKGSLVRLRPVLMTAITDIVGFLPMALSGTAGAEVQRPLATVVIGGLLSATLLTLLVLPVLYQWINRKALLSVAGIVLALFVFNPAHSQSPEGRELSLESALQMARQNHPVFINQNLKIEEAKAKKGLAWDLPKAQTGFQFGQINSDARDPFFEVQQEFGSIPAYLKSAKLAQMGIYLVEAQNLHEARSFELEVKQSYLLWLYQFSLIETLREEMALMESYFEISKLRFDVGEAPYLEKLTADARLTEAKLRLMEAEKELQSASYRLEYFLFERGPFIPDIALGDAKISATKAKISSAAHPLFSVLKARMDVQKLQSELERAKLFPGFYVGYFNQRITDFNISEGGLSGFQFGLAIPLWLKPGQSRNHISQIQERMLEQELNMKSKEISSNWLQIQTQIERQEARLNYYQQTGLPQAEELRLIADRQFKGGEASYMEYLQALSTSMEIKRSFLRAKFELQLSQFQLEFYQNEE
jgi:heavy metal efflux system protein